MRAFTAVARDDWPAVKGYHRLIDQPESSEVSAVNILAPHRERTRRRLQGQSTVLCIQDGTDLNFTSHPQTRDLGVIGRNQTGAQSRAADPACHPCARRGERAAERREAGLVVCADHPGGGVESAEQAAEILRWYTLRWCIEDWHRALKSGCKIDELGHQLLWHGTTKLTAMSMAYELRDEMEQ